MGGYWRNVEVCGQAPLSPSLGALGHRARIIILTLFPFSDGLVRSPQADHALRP